MVFKAPEIVPRALNIQIKVMMSITMATTIKSTLCENLPGSRRKARNTSQTMPIMIENRSSRPASLPSMPAIVKTPKKASIKRTKEVGIRMPMMTSIQYFHRASPAKGRTNTK